MARCFAVVVTAQLAACHGGPPAAKPVPKTTPYLMLFEAGRSWTFPTSTGAPMTCKVADTKRVGDASVARLDCGALLVSGTWVALPAGLYHPYLPVDEPDELALLGEDDLLLSATPKDREHSHVLVGGAQDSIEAFGFAGSWCVRQTTEMQAERRSYALCFDGLNITGGGEDVTTGGERKRVTFGAAPPDAELPDQEPE